jgi:hypothetical protein
MLDPNAGGLFAGITYRAVILMIAEKSSLRSAFEQALLVVLSLSNGLSNWGGALTISLG